MVSIVVLCGIVAHWVSTRSISARIEELNLQQPPNRIIYTQFEQHQQRHEQQRSNNNRKN